MRRGVHDKLDQTALCKRLSKILMDTGSNFACRQQCHRRRTNLAICQDRSWLVLAYCCSQPFIVKNPRPDNLIGKWQIGVWALLVLTALAAVLFMYLEIVGLPDFAGAMRTGKWTAIALVSFLALVLIHRAVNHRKS